MTRAEAATAAGGLLRATAKGLVRAAAYLGPLFAAALVYVAKLCADAVSGIRTLIIRRSRRKAPGRAAEYDQREAALREANATRWSNWRLLPAPRRFAVRLAALALVVASGAMLRSRFITSNVEQPFDASSSASAPSVTATDGSERVRQPSVNLDAAAVRFERASRAQAPGRWTFLTEGPVLAPGSRGDWDDFLVASPWVLREVERGQTQYRMWYRGCHFRGRDRGCAVGHATSGDGVRWERATGPVFEPPDGGARERLHGVTVVRSGGRYYMWYSVRPELFGTRQSSTLHLAMSADGLRWEDAGQVLAATGWDPYPIEPSVLHDGRQFHLWFVDSLRTFENGDFEQQPGAPFLIHFTSADGRTWQEVGRFPKPPDLDKFRAVVERGGDGAFQAMFFSNLDDRYVRAASADGNEWVMNPGAMTTIVRSDMSPDVWSITDATALASEGGAMVWFVTARQGGREEIRVGFQKGS